MREDIEELRKQEANIALSLSQLLGKKIKDIKGHISYEWGGPTFVLNKIEFEDGESTFFEGEHDMPYLCPFPIDESEMLEMFPYKEDL